MSKAGMIKSVINEYGARWLINRMLYSMKLKIMRFVPSSEKLFEKKTGYPKHLDLFDIDVVALELFLKARLKDEEKRRLINTADDACKGVITGFSSIELDYGNPIDWQLSPLTGKRCDEKQKWYRIPDFDRERGDIKVIWEASRFSHFITLARAYLLTGNQNYYEAFSTQLKSWLDKNQYSFGANFKCSQECSLRMVNGLLAYTVFNACGITKPTDAGNMKSLIDRCYKKILSNFFYAYKCIKNNHTISELMGMIVGAWCAGDEKQLDKAYQLLDKVIDEQFTEDGGYRQFSFNYQRLALQDLEVVMTISDKTRKSLSFRSQEKIRNAALLMYQCQDKTGDMPNYGSNDGALVFPVTSCGYRDFRPVINTTYALASGKQLYSNDTHQEELLWFSGGKQLSDFDIDKKERVPRQFADAGLFTIRTADSWAMIVANDYQSRPAHMDQLHFDFWINGLNVLCDGGTYSYASDEGKRLVRNGSHNTAKAVDVYQMNSSGPFMIYDWTKRKLGHCNSEVFEGTVNSLNGYTHSRKVENKGNTYEITDKVDKDYFIHFHTPYEITLNQNCAVIRHNGKELCRIQSSGSLEVKQSQRSLYYLKKDKTTCLSIKGQAGKEMKTKIIIKENKEND